MIKKKKKQPIQETKPKYKYATCDKTHILMLARSLMLVTHTKQRQTTRATKVSQPDTL
jgi:hypothetical protein